MLIVPVPERVGFADVYPTVSPLLEPSPFVTFKVLSTSSVPSLTFTEPTASTVGLVLPVSLPRTSFPPVPATVIEPLLPLIGKSIFAVTATGISTLKPDEATATPSAGLLPVNVKRWPSV